MRKPKRTGDDCGMCGSWDDLAALLTAVRDEALDEAAGKANDWNTQATVRRIRALKSRGSAP